MWRIPAIAALAGHLLIVPLYFAARRWDLSRQPLGFGHWPGEPGWPAGSGSSEWRPGELLLMVSWLLVLVFILCAGTAAGLVALIRRRGPRKQRRQRV